MKIGLVGGSSQQRSLPFNAERTVNLIPVFDQNGKESAALYGTPGLSLFSSGGSGPVRGNYAAANGRAFYVSGNKLFEVTSAGVSTQVGTLDSSSGTVSIDENGLQLAICDGTKVYIFTYASNVFQVVTDVDLPQAATITFLDGYFVINQVDSGKFYISALYDGLTWAALDFATAESSPDELVRVFNALGQLWLMGKFTAEIWTNTGEASFPFQRISGAKMETGILAPHTAVAVDNSLFWLGRDTNGQGIVYRAKGFTPQRVSTNAIELAIQNATDQENILAFTYQDEGHVYYVLTGGGLETSWVYDISTGLWHERAYLNAQGEFEQHLASCHMFAFGKHLVGDRNGGNLYEMSFDYYSDNGAEIARERIYTHISEENTYQRYNRLEIDFETGVGLQTGQGSDPQAALSLSKDGGKTWSSHFTSSIGAVGKYDTRVVFRRLGVARVMTFKLRVTDPVKIVMIGSYLR